MDLLDSILNGMEKPPTIRKPEIKDKEKREKMEKMVKQREEAAKRHKQMLAKFRADFSVKLKSFINTPTTDDIKTVQLRLQPMNEYYRSLVREVCDEHDDEIVAHSFGKEEEDGRYYIIWKLGFEPCEEEIRAMKLGIDLKTREEATQDDGADEVRPTSSKTKRERITGESSSTIAPAIIMKPGKQFGFVPTENKMDQRSIEQIIDDRRKNKKQKTSEMSSTSKEGPTVSEKDPVDTDK